jgi:amino-acid N-acetyltransferase
MQIDTISTSQEVVPLLAAANLPTADIHDRANLSFLVARERGELLAAAGVEHLCSSIGLLRSLVVQPAAQGRGLASSLVAGCEQYAKGKGITTLYLLTTEAADFFLRKGYEAVSRTAAPAEVAATAQFRSLCPSAATLMRKLIP